jgi:hypothetical protein
MNSKSIAVLCVSPRSIYQFMPNVLAYDVHRDARQFAGREPVIAHPPCRCWSKYLHHQAKPVDRPGEMALGLWCAGKVIENGGVLEQPADSSLWTAANLPLPNRPIQNPFLYSIQVEQSWFGFASRKKTWLLISGVPKAWLPPVPFRLDRPQTTSPGLSAFARSRTVTAFAEWLCQIARLSWWQHK